MAVRRATRRKRRTANARKPSCKYCRASGPEIYRYLSRRYVFDVDMARQIVSDGREPVELEPEDVADCVRETRIHWSHVPHVDTQFPGIIAHVFYRQEDGQVARGHALIDGNHRAARSQQLGIPYYVYVLNEEESERILLRAPGKACRCNDCDECEAASS